MDPSLYSGMGGSPFSNPMYGLPTYGSPGGPMFGPSGTPMISMPGGGGYTMPGPTAETSMNYNGTNINLQNPGLMDPSMLNPAASGYLNNIQGLYGMFQNSAAGGAFNPNFYSGMEATQQANLTTSLENQYAAAGLGGSSAAMGGVAQAVNQNQMQWLNRQQSDQMRAMQGLEGLNQQGYGMTTGIQGQYMNYQDASNQDIINLLGIQAGLQGSENQMWGNIAGGIGSLGLGAAALL